MIDIRKLKELVRLMVANDLTELDLRDSEEQVTLRRPSVGYEPPAGPPGAADRVAQAAAAPASTAAPPPAAESREAAVHIESPMVGTFYAKPNPDAEPFVAPGARVTPDTVVCLLEAMKIFNEIKAETSGTIQQVLVNSGDAVEFGQPLFALKPE